ncbi:MAG: class I SAM-dependent methyltransferase [Balneolaceae bacterium]|jgi:methyltransferase (TIGR00027 family)
MKSNQLSQTAAFVAIKFYGLTQIHSYRSIFDHSVIVFYEKLIKSLPLPFRFYHFWLRFHWVRAFYVWAEEKLLPGDLLHVVGRKLYIQRLTEELLSKGYEQLIVLGAGFDHLAFYYSRQGVPCFEFDAPYMSELKRQFLKEQYPLETHPTIIEAHIPNDHLERLLQKHIDPHKKTIIVAEGFFDYLDSETVTKLLIQLRNFFSHNPALITTHFALNELSFFYRKVFQSSVTMVGEKLQFHTSMNDFKKLLEKQGFRISQLFDSKDIRADIAKKLSTSLPILKGFYIFMAN